MKTMHQKILFALALVLLPFLAAAQGTTSGKPAPKVRINNCDYTVLSGLAEVTRIEPRTPKDSSLLQYDEQAIYFTFTAKEGGDLLPTYREEEFEFYLEGKGERFMPGPQYIKRYQVRKGTKYAMRLYQSPTCPEKILYANQFGVGLPNDVSDVADRIDSLKAWRLQQAIIEAERVRDTMPTEIVSTVPNALTPEERQRRDDSIAVEKKRVADSIAEYKRNNEFLEQERARMRADSAAAADSLNRATTPAVDSADVARVDGTKKTTKTNSSGGSTGGTGGGSSGGGNTGGGTGGTPADNTNTNPTNPDTRPSDNTNPTKVDGGGSGDDKSPEEIERLERLRKEAEEEARRKFEAERMAKEMEEAERLRKVEEARLRDSIAQSKILAKQAEKNRKDSLARAKVEEKRIQDSIRVAEENAARQAAIEAQQKAAEEARIKQQFEEEARKKLEAQLAEENRLKEEERKRQEELARIEAEKKRKEAEAEAARKKREEDEIKRADCVFQPKVTGTIQITDIKKVKEASESHLGYAEYEVRYRFSPSNLSDIPKKDRKVWETEYLLVIDPRGKNANPSAAYIATYGIKQNAQFNGFAEVLSTGICNPVIVFSPQLPVDAAKLDLK